MEDTERDVASDDLRDAGFSATSVDLLHIGAQFSEDFAEGRSFSDMSHHEHLDNAVESQG